MNPDMTATRYGWQCPGCRTHYSPDVAECRCSTRPRTLADRLNREPPIRVGGAPLPFSDVPVREPT